VRGLGDGLRLTYKAKQVACNEMAAAAAVRPSSTHTKPTLKDCVCVWVLAVHIPNLFYLTS